MREVGPTNLIPIFPLDLTISEQINNACNTIVEQVLNKEIPPLYSIVNIAEGGRLLRLN